jgi:CRISPR-associated protein Cmr6
MPLIVPLPQGVRGLLRACADHTGLVGVHPGLVLDKFALSWDDAGATRGLSERVQKPTVEQVVRLSAAPPPGLPFDDLVRRWERATAGAVAFTGTTAGPLTLHLARASALENAGICLHPLYGFTYLPGSGLKGLARAFAETVAAATPDDVRRVFGFTEKAGSAAGSVVFHDAWPKVWPRLATDILNSHHPEYYSKGEPPGDWEDPVPVYFLSVPAGVPFRFAVAPRRDDVPAADVELAKGWLVGGLTVLGCGAKTATGYGHFAIEDAPRPAASPTRPEFTATLELVTPAFLAGASQQREDCDLRPATLRGQLRWWWRTMHAGFVDVPTLKRMEAAVWGDTKRGGAVRVTVTAAGPVVPQPFDRQDVIRANRLPPTPDRKTSQGLTYHSYGMDERKEGVQVRRHYLPPGTKWAVSLSARPGQLQPATDKDKPIPLGADLLLGQAPAALGLLCHFGGVGAKARKGFGSFADLPGFDLAAVKRAAAEFRGPFGRGAASFQDALAGSPALEQLVTLEDIPTGGTNWWLALDQLAAAAQGFAKGYKHQLKKKALGLPRRVGAPTSGEFRPGWHVHDRHSSPVLYHLGRGADGKLVARVAAFPAAELPDLATSRAFLSELLEYLRADLPGRFKDHVAGKAAPAGPRVSAPAPVAVGPQLRPGARVTATVVADPKGKGRPFAECQGLVGNILGVPAGRTLAMGEAVELVVNSVNVAGRQIAFKWPG